MQGAILGSESYSRTLERDRSDNPLISGQPSSATSAHCKTEHVERGALQNVELNSWNILYHPVFDFHLLI